MFSLRLLVVTQQSRATQLRVECRRTDSWIHKQRLLEDLCSRKPCRANYRYISNLPSRSREKGQRSRHEEMSIVKGRERED